MLKLFLVYTVDTEQTNFSSQVKKSYILLWKKVNERAA